VLDQIAEELKRVETLEQNEFDAILKANGIKPKREDNPLVGEEEPKDSSQA
jgi:hypothetical protein